MFEAITRDLGKLEGVHLTGLWDARLGDVPAGIPVDMQTVCTESAHQEAFHSNAGTADATMVIAPESDDQLLMAAKRVMNGGGRLLGPSPQLISLTSNKSRLADYLAERGILVQQGVQLEVDAEIPQEFAYPAVLKPNDGAGSQQTWLLSSSADAAQRRPPMKMRLETLHPGTPASVAVLCGPSARVPLPVCLQRVAIERRCVHYQGGAVLIPGSLSKRATRLAMSAVESLPAPLGFFGVDLMLGDDPAGNEDVVLEINPRLTTSYVGLRAALDINLAGLMLDVICGEDPELCFDPRTVEFSADGSVWPGEQTEIDAWIATTTEVQRHSLANIRSK